ncbi:TPA: hypothetical protein JAN72_13335 [Legionella pneumophila]|uniref:Rod shape-determining protein MreB n=1 Tax=Legionella pneumophila TaxID=446 RepID=A0AAN5KQW2_LEGPN|nr:hypothetical protein [Legionella pneumophila]HAT1972591.1 hypothetical protein [Legionella pneumophila]HAT6957735.1 hypothetical protein [Legionella pneumophila]HEN4769978.1 hypothetical protein [Legionella pneumophila]
MKKIVYVLLLISSLAHANCVIYFNEQPVNKKLSDPLYSLLSNAEICPQSIQELRNSMRLRGLKEVIGMVANRGRNNSTEGSFSFFESVYGALATDQLIAKGELFLGYFTRLKDGLIILDQKPRKGKLLIEAISWDTRKTLYNFYELRGIENGGVRWFYRGNSKDAYKDNTWLYRISPEGENHFGSRMRCSACHNSGGPILKEQALPHNDWWTNQRPLILQPNKPDRDVGQLLEQVSDASLFASDVTTGMQHLLNSKKMQVFQGKLSLQEQLRPLFCTTEINLQSSTDSSETVVSIPSAFWLNPLLGDIDLTISIEDYNQLLKEFNIRFPETSLQDADHAWLTPVKGEADLNAIKQLIQHNIISKRFAQSVLMIDFTNPLFSSKRCELLKLIPESSQTNGKEWMEPFLVNLRNNQDQFKGARQLADYMSNGQLDSKELMKKIKIYEYFLNQSISTRSGLRKHFQHLIELRKAVFTSELSQNPLGQILEPGFRVIFPESQL